MSKTLKSTLFLAVVLMAIFAQCKNCQHGQILVHQNCISCTNFKNTESSQMLSVSLQQVNQCPCKQGFKWSRVISQCIAFTPPIKQKRLLYDEQNQIKAVVTCNTTSQYLNPALNKCACDPRKNYAPVNSSCVNCTQTPFSNGLANNLGCICRNGLYWSSSAGLCLCPSGSIFIGQTCTTCAKATLPSGVTTTDCNSCSNSKGFAAQKLGCFLCVSQNGASTSVLNGSCTCNGKGQIWKPLKGSCGCDWAQLYVTSITSNGGFSCIKCPYILSGNNTVCPCGVSFLQQDLDNQICTDISYDPNINNPSPNSNQGIFSCKQGYKINNNQYPYKCVQGYNVSAGYYSSSTQSYIACSNTSCISCDLTAGFFLVVDTNQCLFCFAVTGSTGVATSTGCVCQSGRLWNSISLTCDITNCTAGMIYQPNSKLCICDTVISITVGSNCIACSSISLSNGYAATSTSCGCNSPLSWVSTTTGGLCTNAGCNLATQIALANGNCFTCPTTANNGLGAASGSACKCNTNFVWSPTTVGGSCVCDLTKAYTIGSKCIACPNNTQTTGTGDGKGGCICKSASSSWVVSASAGSCQLCNTQANVVVLSNGSCFNCNSSKAYTLAKVVNTKNDSCTCTSTSLTWNSKGFCDCNTSSVMIITGNTFVCFPCSNASAFTSAKIDSFNCSCVSNNLKWNSTNKACGCSTANSVVRGSGSTASCFTCVVGGYIVGISADQTACLCIGTLVWLSDSSNCGCLDKTQIIIGTGVSTKCLSCSTLKYGKTAITSTTCSCLGTGLAFNSSCGGSCQCPIGSIILSNFTCSSCPAGTSPLTPYECLCPTGSIWNYASQNCIQCGTASILNSQPNIGTNFACVCNNGFIWDVMTQSCISSNACSTPSTSCMKCPTGTASVLITTKAIKLSGGALVQSSLNGSITNYNQIKGYQCTCASGYSWDSLRLRCYITNLL